MVLMTNTLGQGPTGKIEEDDSVRVGKDKDGKAYLIRNDKKNSVPEKVVHEEKPKRKNKEKPTPKPEAEETEE